MNGRVNLDGEEWKRISEFENYEVSNMGRVRNIKLCKLLKLNTRKGYYEVTLGKKSRSIHRMVADAFVPNPDDKPQVNHLGDKLDNRACMLEWVTQQENAQHAADNITTYNRTRVHRCDLNTDEILQTYESIPLAAADGYDPDCISKCLKGHRKKTGGFRWKRADPFPGEIENLEGEEWRPLIEAVDPSLHKFENYMVSNMGRVRLVHREKLIQPDDKRQIKLSHQQKKTSFSIWRLVMLAFTPNPEGKSDVDHIDSDYDNNRLDNLRWATREENRANENTVRKSRLTVRATKDGVTQTFIGIKEAWKQLGISDDTIRRYAGTGREWKGYIFELEATN
jgi:hypothetical protein